MFFIIIFTMIKIYMYSCLLSALSFVEMKILNIKGCVGERVSFKCSDWDTLIDVTSNDKYFCKSPCTKDKHIIIKAAPGKSTQGNRMRIITRGKDLFVTFTNLEKSDSNTYYCGVEITGPDAYIKVILKVTEAEPSITKKTPETVDTFTTLSSAVSNSSDVSASNTTLSTPTPSAPATQAAVMVVLLLTRKLMKRGQRGLDVSSPHEGIHNSARPDEVYQSLHPLTMDEDQVYSSLTERSALHTALPQL
ncbi:CMRF35-like molecule 1 isoform X3 [Trematomus bernacchii]|uniref:CMRF35-like molecule 1 isoform X3 n=1 Tax=Trematomus bernacchii TaxID=40690 RepID=UPI00146EA57B|nr:CMRF35-like molecule 1 isoform X3 [Trematomus bernacchii]